MRIYSSVVAGIGILAAVGLATRRLRSQRDAALTEAQEDPDADAPSTLEG